jgi:fatty acid desaturase
VSRANENLMTGTSKTLSRAEADAFGRELDALRAEVAADLGQRDTDHMRAVIRTVHRGEAVGRFLLAFGLDPVSFVLGAGTLGVSKILENMEVGHNVMHGQYDWTRDPGLDSHAYDWDLVCPASDWRHSHNYIHHTFTNILGKDRDVGYSYLRIHPEQEWRSIHLTQPIVTVWLAFMFQWGVAMHNLEADDFFAGRISLSELHDRARPFLTKVRWQLIKDYLLFPALALANAPRVIAGNLLANMIRNLWTFAVIFCGHFPDGVSLFREEDTVDESRGQWYVRQLRGSANIEGGRIFHVMTGHLSHQIEHHLFPDIPAARYPEMAPRVREICERYGQFYCTGSFRRQLGTVARRILRYALPGGSVAQPEQQADLPLEAAA